MPDELLWKGVQWLEERCNDKASPLTGDARVQLDAAQEAFRQQQDNLGKLEYTAGMLLAKLRGSRGNEDPDVIKAIRLMGVNVYAALSEGVGVRGIANVISFIDEFVKSWSSGNWA